MSSARQGGSPRLTMQGRTQRIPHAIHDAADTVHPPRSHARQPRGDGAADEVAGGCRTHPQRHDGRILRPTELGRAHHQRGDDDLAGGQRLARIPGDLHRRDDRGLEARHAGSACQGRQDLPTALASGPGLTQQFSRRQPARGAVGDQDQWRRHPHAHRQASLRGAPRPRDERDSPRGRRLPQGRGAGPRGGIRRRRDSCRQRLSDRRVSAVADKPPHRSIRRQRGKPLPVPRRGRRGGHGRVAGRPRGCAAFAEWRIQRHGIARLP